MKIYAKLLNGTIGSAMPPHVRRPARRWLHRTILAIREFDRVQRDYERLLELPDHVLKDVGLERCQLRNELKFHRGKLIWIFGQ